MNLHIQNVKRFWHEKDSSNKLYGGNKLSELKVTNCELCFKPFKNNGTDNYGIGYYSKRAGSIMICADCLDARSTPQTTLSRNCD